jgi:putative SOS response-associated peptidase YedK
MPVILRREDERLWLDPEVTDVQVVLPLLQPYASESMSAYEVSRAVNAVANDGPELIAPSDRNRPVASAFPRTTRERVRTDG